MATSIPPTSNSTPSPVRTDPSDISDNYASPPWRPGAGIGVVIGFVAIFAIAGVGFGFWRRGRLRKRRERGRGVGRRGRGEGDEGWCIDKVG
jgi:hypothetical protein